MVAGFGLTPVVLAPLSAWLLDLFASTSAQGTIEKGVSQTMIVLGVVTRVVVGALAMFVRNPPEVTWCGRRPERQLSSTVWSALTGDPRTRFANIRVAADGADVLITGSADNAKALDAIGEVAGAVPGVAGVQNEVGVGGHWQW